MEMSTSLRAPPTVDNIPIFNRNLDHFLTTSPVLSDEGVFSQIVLRKVSPEEREHQVSVVLTRGTLELSKILSWDTDNDTA